MKPSALYPGTFDPVTRGHEDIIARASSEYDLHVGVASNSGKSPVFTLQERIRLLQKVVKQYDIDPLSVVRVSGSTARYMKRSGISHIIRGKRDALDEIAEAQLEHFNTLEFREMSPVLFDSSNELQYASSSAAKMLMRANHDPSSIINLEVQEALSSRLLSQYPIYISGGMGAGKSTIARAIQDEARAVSIPVKYIELDTIGHAIYASLDDAYYKGIRQRLRETFGDDISPDGDYIDRSILRQKLSDASGNLNKPQFQKLDVIMGDAIEFCYRDMIEGFQGIILIDGIMKEGFSFSRLAHHNTLIVDTKKSVRIERVKRRYEAKGDTTVTDSFISSIIDAQPNKGSMVAMMNRRISTEQHGSVETVDNTISVDTNKAFFKVLNQIDRYGELRATWILSKLGIHGDMRTHLNYLQSQYNQTHRYYHTWEHIIESLTTLFQMAIDTDIPEDELVTIGAAILGHDLIYSVDADNYTHNETHSARTWSEYLRRHGVDVGRVSLISELIAETQHGRVSVPDRLISHVLHDVDMAILGAPWERYRIYRSDVYSEFAPMMSRRDLQIARRDKFLLPVQSLGGGLYQTEWAQSRLADNLMQNVRREIEGI